jgi:exonuclease VII large subunit
MDYKNGQIYCIRSHQTDQIYIGSTCTTLAKRFYDHKKKSNNRCSNEITQYTDAYIELIENFPCNSKKELNKREGQHIRNDENCVNKQIAGRTQKEHYIDNKERILEEKKIYQINNKEQILKQKKLYYLKKKFESTLEQLPSSSSP